MRMLPGFRRKKNSPALDLCPLFVMSKWRMGGGGIIIETLIRLSIKGTFSITLFVLPSDNGIRINGYLSGFSQKWNNWARDLYHYFLWSQNDVRDVNHEDVNRALKESKFLYHLICVSFRYGSILHGDIIQDFVKNKMVENWIYISICFRDKWEYKS